MTAASQIATQQVILQALEADQHDPHASFQARVTGAASLAAAARRPRGGSCLGE
jgi:hypothetical protein